MQFKAHVSCKNGSNEYKLTRLIRIFMFFFKYYLAGFDVSRCEISYTILETDRRQFIVRLQEIRKLGMNEIYN